MNIVKLREPSEFEAKDARERERRKIYEKWGKGLAQQEQREKNLKEHLHEASKQLSRYKDDADLEKHLKGRERLGDPMLEYIKRKTSVQSGQQCYGSSEPTLNRYGIWPGFRWDGVNRSNGFEERLIELKNDVKADEEVAYKWSVEEM